MERWYNKKIKIQDARVSQYRFTGMFENETLEEALHALQLTASFRFRIDGNNVFIEKP
jgi:ferric-dicitrate binding protein FerR (iron transport regulator)